MCHANPGNGGTDMTSSFQSLAELRDLLDALCEETITATQMQRLEELVLTHPEAEAYYVQYMGLYADLARHVAAVPVTTVESLRGRIAGISTVPGREVSAATSPVSPRIRYSLWGALGLTGVAAGLLIALALPWQRARDDTTSTEPG